MRPLACLVVALCVTLAGCADRESKPLPVRVVPPVDVREKKAADIYSKYPGLWEPGPKPIVDTIFNEEKVTQCSQYEFKRHPEGGSYLVRCKNNRYYIVWTGMRKASGPYEMRKSSRAAVKASEEAMRKAAASTAQPLPLPLPTKEAP